MNLKKLGSIAATGALVLMTATPAFASTNINNGFNGAGSFTSVGVNNNSSTVVSQSNTVTNTNIVTSVNNTGGNSVGGNTSFAGGNGVSTGNSVSNTTITNNSGANVAFTAAAPTPGTTNVNNGFNGAHSVTLIGVNTNNSNFLGQSNSCSNTNVVTSLGNTGLNHNGGNTSFFGGNGVSTGHSVSNTTVTNNCGLNAGL